VFNGVAPNQTITQSFQFTIRAGGHDDRRDPLGSGIKGWKYSVTDPDQDLAYYKEGEWQFDKPLNTLEQQCSFSITIPWPATRPAQQHIIDSLVHNPPLFLGAQGVDVAGLDIKDTDSFSEGIRGISPEFDENGNVIPANNWIVIDYFFANYARRDARHTNLYLKLVK